MRIGTVPYYNALPLVSALKSPRIAMPPSELERALLDDRLDVALMPLFSIIKHGFHAYPEAGVIGADGAVGSVAIFTKKEIPLDQISSLYFDDESRTSVALAKILLHKMFQRNLRSLTSLPLENCNAADAQLLIGDKALFFQENGYRCHDLADLWKRFTHQGFVFATWASKEPLTQDFIDTLKDSRIQGLKHIDKIAAHLPPRRREKIITYLTRNIVYEMTPALQSGWDSYAGYLEELDLMQNEFDLEQSDSLFSEEFMTSGI